MKILLFGKNGQLGWELQRSLTPIGNVIALERNSVNNFEGLCGDLTNLNGLKETIRRIKPAVIVNAAAYTAVDQAETELDLSNLINSQAPLLLAQEALKLDALLVHYSTDYVFDGLKNGTWNEGDSPNPINQYGKSKLAGEIAIQLSGCKHLIFRTSWVYGLRGNNFTKTILKLSQVNRSLNMIADQHGAPTGADLIADCTAHAILETLIHSKYEGLYHLVASGETTWFNYAKFIINELNALDIELMIKELLPITTSEYHTPAMRPLNSKLDTKKFISTFGLNLPHWQDGVRRLLLEIKS